MLNWKRTGPWRETAAALGLAKKQLPGLLTLSSKAEAQYAAKMMRKAISSGGKSNGAPWPKLSPWTSSAKGHGRKLRETKAMRDSIKARRVGAKWTAGPDPKGSDRKWKGSISLEELAKIHENGAEYWVEVTTRMAAFLAIRARELGISPKKGGKLPVGSKILIVIPRRSFIEDTRKKHFGTLSVTRRFISRTVASLAIVKFFKKHSKGKGKK